FVPAQVRRYERFAVRQNLGAGRIHSARSFFKLGFPQKRQLLWDSDLPWSMWARIEKLRIWSCFVIVKKPPQASRRWPRSGSGAYAPLRAFLRSKNLGAGAIHLPRSFFKLGFPQKRQLLSRRKCAVTSVLPSGKTSAQGGFTPPGAFSN